MVADQRARFIFQRTGDDGLRLGGEELVQHPQRDRPSGKVVRQAREHIVAGDFASWKDAVLPKITSRL